ncbi:hypothetical protein, partial [Streptomyces cellostaticus]|uniref:hypothetical protein n=1 Tax=Streptomyces cellostaticus TaxID=67285 RepID=UPI002026E79B
VPAAAREADAEEMRAIFGAFQRGLDRGRRGLPTAAAPEAATREPDAPHTHADEGTDTDDAR